MNMRKERSMILELDLRNAINGSANNFTCELMRLMMKSDKTNFSKLASLYPEEAETVNNFRNGTLRV